MRNSDKGRQSGVICANSMDVPDIPESYNFTGYKKMVIPNALISPAMIRKMKFLSFRSFKLERMR